MFKFLVFALLVAVAVGQADWRECIEDPGCPPVDLEGTYPTFFNGPTCHSFWKCSHGRRCIYSCAPAKEGEAQPEWNLEKGVCVDPAFEGHRCQTQAINRQPNWPNQPNQPNWPNHHTRPRW